MTDVIKQCDVVPSCEECPRYADDCDGDKRIEPTDYISGADAIKAVASITMSIHLSDVICDKLLALPSAEAEWIPCSERLPEDIKPVIVTWKNNDPKSYYQYIVGKHFIGTAHYLNGKWFWYSSTTEDLLAEYGRCDGEEFDEAIEVVAWMPLPEPYREDGEVEL